MQSSAFAKKAARAKVSGTDVPSYDVFTLQGARGSDPNTWTYSMLEDSYYGLAPRELAANSSTVVAYGLGRPPLFTSLPLGMSPWSDKTISPGGPQLEDLAFGAGRFVLVGQRIYASVDGAAWEEQQYP